MVNTRAGNVVACLLALVGVACKPGEAVYPSDIDLGAGVDALLPRNLCLNYSEDLTKGRVKAAPDLSQLATLAIRAVPTKAIKMARARQWRQLPAALLVPEQAEEVERLLPVVAPLIEKLWELNALMTDRLGDQMRRLAAAGGAPAVDPEQAVEELMRQLHTALVSAPIVMDGEDAAVMDLELKQIDLPGMQRHGQPSQAADEPRRLEIPFVMLEDGRWRIELPYFPSSESLVQTRSNLDGQVPGVVQQIDQVRREIESGQITDPQLVGQRLMMSSLGLMGAVSPVIESVKQAMAAGPAGQDDQPDEPEGGSEDQPDAPDEAGGGPE